MLRLVFAGFIILVASATYYGGKTAISEAGIKPDSPLYFIDSLVEHIDIWGTKEKEEKVKKITELIEEKMHEASLLLEEGNRTMAERSLGIADGYTNDALGFINSLKGEGKSTEELTENLGAAVLKKQELLAGVYKDAPDGAKPYIESQIKENKEDVEELIKHLDETTNEKLSIKIEQVAELVDDKITEAREAEDSAKLAELESLEKKYNIWVDHFYATTGDGATSVMAHIRRRDPQCSQFTGEFVLYINDTYYRKFKIVANGYDDIRQEFDKFYLEKGNYVIRGELLTDKGEIVSRKEFKFII